MSVCVCVCVCVCLSVRFLLLEISFGVLFTILFCLKPMRRCKNLLIGSSRYVLIT